MKGYIAQIERLTLDNQDFRRVLYTARSTQLVLMSLKPGEEIGEEIHKDEDQFIRVEAGEGEAAINGVRYRISDGSAVIIPAGARHNVVNTGAETLKLYTLYSPPHHRDGVVHRTRAEAQADAEHFDGRTSEAG